MNHASRWCPLFLVLICFLGLAVEVEAEEPKIGLVLVQPGRSDHSARALQVASDAFLRSRRFTVVERQALEQVFQEKGLKGFIGDTEGVAISDIEGLDWIGLLSYSMEGGAFQLSVRMLEVGSAEVLHTIDSERGGPGSRMIGNRLRTAGARWLDRKVGSTLGMSAFAGSFEDTADTLEDAASGFAAAGERLLENLLETFPAQGHVIQLLDDRHVVVDLGQEEGLREGDNLEVFTYGPNILHPVTGREIRGPEIIQAVLRVRSVETGISTCKIKKGGEPIGVGAVVRFRSNAGMTGRLMDSLPFDR